ncbi:MAG TPA: adenylate/guanylate cyclase domain-containing protein [Acidimicrobiales bacterium]|jgi:adenylate cyclase|nr:adenylate/guanylate cyclase domain-containing protein [Acidimicrobiales bacterium]
MTMETGAARQAGEAAVGAVRRLLARKAAEMIQHDPDAAEVALEMGLIDRRWLENPNHAPITTAGPSEVIERFWERAVETRPSRLSALGLGAAQLLTSRLAPASGRAVAMTVVFTDLEGFTSFTDRHGDEAALALLRDHQKEAGPIIRREGGRIVKHIGDGLLCTFPDPQGGLRAAVALLDAAPEPLRLRAGVHLGEAIASPDDIIGHVVNVAARVAETAKGGQAVATLDTVQAAGPTSGVVIGKARSRRLKGITERVTLVDISRDPTTRTALNLGGPT